MNKKNFQIMIYVLLVLIIYVLPFLIKDTGSGMFVLLLLMPLLLYAISLVNALKLGFQWYFSLIVGLLFIPTIFLFYNESAMIYVFVYTAISYIGQGVGVLICKWRNR